MKLANKLTSILCCLIFNLALAGEYTFNLACMSDNLIKATTQQKDISVATSSCSTELKYKLGQIIDPQHLTDDVIEVILSMVIAQNKALYGNSNAASYEDIINEEFLNCGNQTLLMGYLLPERTIHIIGFDGGVVGNHAQVIYTNDNIKLLLDPTISAIAAVSYDTLIQGKPAEYVVLIHPNPDNS